MSAISSVGGASSRFDRLFSKVDADGSGNVDKSELQTMLDKISERSGQSLGDSDELMTKLDSDGDGSLSKSELEAGMKDLMPPPSSTMEFAQRAGGPPPGPPPDGAGPNDSSDSSDSSTTASSTASSTDPLDTNGDGKVSTEERVAAVVKDFMKNLVAALSSDQDASAASSTSISVTA